jgi:DNA replication and repair protein RecF
VDREAFAEAPKEALLAGLRAHAAEERRRGTTAVGPHRDDIYFGLDGRSGRNFGSQGQQRSLVLALKMAEIELITSTFGAPPVLLLDDMSSELDRCRNLNLMEFLKKREMQVFITTTSLGNVALEDREEQRSFQIREGKIL